MTCWEHLRARFRVHSTDEFLHDNHSDPLGGRELCDVCRSEQRPKIRE